MFKLGLYQNPFPKIQSSLNICPDDTGNPKRYETNENAQNPLVLEKDRRCSYEAKVSSFYAALVVNLAQKNR